MKIRESAMPDMATWESFFRPRQMLVRLRFPTGCAEAADFGCGYGTFALAAAALTTGTVHAFDIEPRMVATVRRRAAAAGVAHIDVVVRDVVADGTGLPDASVGYAMLFNIPHGQHPLDLLHEARRILRPGGKVAVVHWVHDTATPRGPPFDIRPRPEQCVAWLQAADFDVPHVRVALPPWHYGVIGVKRPR